MKRAADEMGKKETFRGYGPEQGYPFLREANFALLRKPRREGRGGRNSGFGRRQE